MQGQQHERLIGFSLSGETVSVASFIAVAAKLTDLLRELETTLTGCQGLEWHIADLRTGSANLAIRPFAQSPAGMDDANQIVDAALQGIATVEDAPKRPPHFTDQTLRCAKALTDAIQGEADRLAIFSRGGAKPHRVAVSQRLAAHVDKLIGPTSIALGTLEGKLEALTVHNNITFSIYDSITNRRIACSCDRETLNVAIKHFDKRVAVSGQICFDARGYPTSMRVDQLWPVATTPRPQAKDIRGLFAGNEIDIDEWSRFVREE